MSYTVIDDFVVPDSLQEGSDVTVSLLLRNTGALGRLDYYLDGNPLNPSDYMFIGGGGAPNIPPGGSVWVEFTSPFSMPAWDYTLIATNEDSTSVISRTITLSGGVPTSLTISAPTSVEPDEAFTITGILYETATGIPITNQIIDLSYNGVSLGSAMTGINGDYQIQAFIPTEGTYTLTASFAGSTVLGASTSTRKVTTGALEIPPFAPIVAVALFAYAIFRK